MSPARLTMKTPQLTAMSRPSWKPICFGRCRRFPGVSTLSDFSAGLYVRGGSADQNLILLDDIDVYNPSHLFGFFSTFNVDAVKTVDLQKAGFPARYGGRLSSLLDVHNRDGNRKQLPGVVRSSIIASSATLEGPWRSGSWMISGRHTYIEPLARSRQDRSAVQVLRRARPGELRRRRTTTARASATTPARTSSTGDNPGWTSSSTGGTTPGARSGRTSSPSALLPLRARSQQLRLARGVRLPGLRLPTKNQIDDLSLQGDVSPGPRPLPTWSISARNRSRSTSASAARRARRTG